MTRQAISPRFAIRIRLNMFFLLELLGRILAGNVACADAGNKPVVQQKSKEATVPYRRVAPRSRPVQPE
jgi:hypothetical protein